jgi:hypothetical protein
MTIYSQSPCRRATIRDDAALTVADLPLAIDKYAAGKKV